MENIELSSSILKDLEDRLKSIEENSTINDDLMQYREDVLEYLYSKYPRMEYKKIMKDGKPFFNFCLPFWKISKTSLIFSFDDHILAILCSKLPHLSQTPRIVCNIDESKEIKRLKIEEFIEKTDDFVNRYTFIIELRERVRAKYSDIGNFEAIFDYQTDKTGKFFLLGYIPGIGNFHFNIVADGSIIFAKEELISRKVFNINANKNDRTKWTKIESIEISLFGHFNQGINIVYENIEKAIINALKYKK